jgi:hypothetical protein
MTTKKIDTAIKPLPELDGIRPVGCDANGEPMYSVDDILKACGVSTSEAITILNNFRKALNPAP